MYLDIYDVDVFDRGVEFSYDSGVVGEDRDYFSLIRYSLGDDYIPFENGRIFAEEMEFNVV
jgi:hypothetical protein